MSKRILIVDDDVALLEAVAFALKRKEYMVSVANSVEDALLRVEEHVFDVVLLDLKVGTRSGEEFLSFLEIFSMKVPKAVIVMTGNAAEFNLGEIKKMVSGVFEKPFSVDALIEEIEKPSRS